ncbi:MAG TPA: hypothetical protein VGA56_07270 [Opitutaceae bacterium]
MSITGSVEAKRRQIADGLHPKTLHRKLDSLVEEYCPVASEFEAGYHWSLMQIEYATDIVFRSRDALKPLYDGLVRTAVHAVRAEHVATFLGKKLDPRYQGEVGNDFNIRIQGTRIRHQMGRNALKMYDKFGYVLRIETVVNDVSFFKHHRWVEHRDGTRERKLAPVKKTLYSFGVMAELMAAANRRYLEFLSSLDDDSEGRRKLQKLSDRVRDQNRSYRGSTSSIPSISTSSSPSCGVNSTSAASRCATCVVSSPISPGLRSHAS